MDGKYFYDGLDVITGELDAVAEKYGVDAEDLKEGEVGKEVRDKILTYFKNEADLLIKDLENDEESIANRFDVAAEDENGVLWIYIKAFNVDRWQELFGTEPE